MKIRGFGWGMACIVALSLVAFSGQTKPTDNPSAERAAVLGISAEKIQLSKGIDLTWPGLVTLKKQILKDIEMLESYFKKGQTAQIVQLLESRYAVIAGKGYELMYANGSGKFWLARRSEAETMEISVAMIYVSNVMGPHPKLPFPEEKALKPPIGVKAFNAVAFVALEIHIITKTKSGSLLHNDKYFMNLAYRHQWPCLWDDEPI